MACSFLARDVPGIQTRGHRYARDPLCAQRNVIVAYQVVGQGGCHCGPGWSAGSATADGRSRPCPGYVVRAARMVKHH